MQEIKILRLTMDNFKGRRHLDLDLNGGNLNVYGTNAAGKTTIFDAFTWLLFGKNSNGSGSFGIKPLDKAGQVRDHTAITTVEALLLTGQGELALRRTYYEKWSTKRGSAAETFDGHSSDFYVNGVPVKKYEFEDTVNQLVNEDLFRMLTNVYWFCRGLDWRSRRNVLFELAQTEDDRSIMSRSPQFAPLLEAMGGLSLEQFRKKLQAEQKALSGVRNDGPVRLDECQKVIEELRSVDFSALELERDGLEEKRRGLAQDLLQLEHNTLLDKKKGDLRQAELQRMDLDAQRNKFHLEQQSKRPDVHTLTQTIQNRTEQKLELEQTRQILLDKTVWCEAQVEECRKRWKEINASEFQGGTCPTCGQTLPAGALAEAQAQFQAEKERRLSELVRLSEVHKKDAAETRALADKTAQSVAGLEGEIAQCREALERAQAIAAQPLEDPPEYQEKRGALDAQIDALKAEVSGLSSDGSAVRAAVKAQLDALDLQIAQVGGVCAKKSVLEFTCARMEALRADMKQAADRLERLEGMAFLCEEFVRYKTQYIEASINDKFHLVRWKLFSEQVNGGLAECCEASVDGIPYGDLNDGMKFNAGLDAIAALSEHYGVRAPLVLDGTESFVELVPVGTQVIRLEVSKQDRELRFEYA